MHPLLTLCAAFIGGGMLVAQTVVTFPSDHANVVSNGDQIQFGMPPANTILTSAGNAAAATGSASRNNGVITLFQ